MRVASLVAAFAAGMTLRAGTVFTTDGTLYESDIALDNGLIVQGPRGPGRIPMSNVLRARFNPPVSGDLQPGLVLVGGARIAGTFSTLSESVIRFDQKQVAVPGQEVAWAVYQPLTAQQASQVPRGKTGALLPGGDFFEGTPRGGDPTMGRVLNPIFGPRTFNAAQKEITVLVVRDIRPQPAAFDVMTRDGSIYPAIDVIARDAGGVILRHPAYDGLRVPLGDLVEIRASASRLIPIESMEPPKVDPAPGGEADRSFAAGKALDGGPLKLGERPIPSGFQSTVGTALAWPLPQGTAGFLALVSPCPSTPAGQKISFAAYADNRLIARSLPLAAGDPPAVFRCALAGASRLTLRVEGASGSGTWAEPVLLRR